MKQFLTLGFFFAATLAASLTLADTVTLKDGTTREGKVVAQTDKEVSLHVNEDGMQATIVIPMTRVSKVTLGPLKETPAPAKPPSSLPPASPSLTHAAGTSPTGPAVATRPTTGPALTTSPLPPTHGFLAEMGSALIGRGPGDPRRLPPDIQALWKQAVTLDAAGKRANELDVMRALDQAFSASPGGAARLDGVSRHERDQPFGLWMASVHWDVLATSYRTGMFDTKDVREIERPALIGLLKEKTGPALEPLKTYFPPIDEKTGKQAPFKPAQLQGITVDNALDVKDKAAFAHAILLAQVQLQPDMPAADRALLLTQLANVNRVLSRANDLEPQAKAAEQKKKLAEERAKTKG